MSYQNSTRPRSGGRPMHQRPGVQTYRPGKSPRNKSRRTLIHPSKFINRATVVAQESVYNSQNVFADFKFVAPLQSNIDRKGYMTPSAIQDQAIPLVMAGRDVIGLANTGTGKTAAFLLPIIDHLYTQRNLRSVLILAPTRELAEQINEQFRGFSDGMKLFSTLVVGGTNIDRQIRELRRGPHVIIATPGRLRDLMQRGEVTLSTIDVLVLDEADRMLDMGFVNDIRDIVSQTPASRQTLFFSATITPSVQQLAQTFLRNPETVSVRTADTSERVDQDVVEAGSKDEKLSILVDLLSQEDFKKVLLFGETKFGVQRLSDYLEKAGVPSVAIHGNKSQSQRQRALKAFKDEKVRVMVATDVAARGLDIPDVSHVINFDQPATYDDYVHRIGRTGRGGATGKALTFVDRR